MAVGYPVSAADVNAKAGALVTNLWNALNDVRQFKLWLDDSAHNDTYLTGLGISGADITVLRAAFADLGGTNSLWAVSHGTYVPPGVNNFFFNAKNLTGTNYTG
jgi:hypothetical protein